MPKKTVQVPMKAAWSEKNSDVVGFLKAYRLMKYAATFRAEAMDMETLSMMETEDFADISIPYAEAVSIVAAFNAAAAS